MGMGRRKTESVKGSDNMKRLTITPEGWWPCALYKCPPGFFIYNDRLCFKTEYGSDEAYCDSGEVFWGGAVDKENRKKLIVQPVIAVWEEEN